MAEPSSEKAAAEPVGAATAPASPDSSATAPKRPRTPFVVLRGEVSAWKGALFGLLCIVLCLAAWWMLTRGSPEERILSPSILPSPQATFESFPSLWFDRALTRNAYASLRRVTLGFGLAALVGVPLGVLCGCFPGVNAFFAPLTIMGRNIPVAALIPLTFSLFGIGEFQKVMFIFVACVAFIIIDAATAIREIESRYVDTAFTLGANRRQVIFKVLVPLALPGIFNSLRLLFGLAFGYIMLAELVKLGDTSGGLGDIINTSLRRGIQTHIILVLMIIPLVALAIDRFLLWVQRQLFPYRYGGSGILHRGVRFVLRGYEDAKSLLFRSAAIPATTADDPRETR
jgi:NitT/TauT family transport system permease protein